MGTSLLRQRSIDDAALMGRPGLDVLLDAEDVLTAEGDDRVTYSQIPTPPPPEKKKKWGRYVPYGSNRQKKTQTDILKDQYADSVDILQVNHLAKKKTRSLDSPGCIFL